MARLIVQVKDAVTGAPIPWAFVQVDGLSESTGLDGVATFEVALGATKTIKVRHTVYRPWTRSVSITAERVEVLADLEKAIL